MTAATALEVERRRRIRLAVAAYAYEIMDDPIMSDHDFDRLSEQVETHVSTGNRRLDKFFKDHFEPASGMWVRKHPDLTALHRTYERLKEVMTMEINVADLPDQTAPQENYPEPVPGRVAHIDADFMCYQVSAETKDELTGVRPRRTLETMKHNARSGLEHLMKSAGATSYVAHITPSGSNKGNRDNIALTKGYQDNRKGKEKPEHLQAVRAFIGEYLPSMIHFDQEADDGMSQANYNAADPNLSVIVSKDKDLRMAPGLHYDFDTETVVDVDDPFGDIWVDRSKKAPKVLGWGTKFFWAQLLMGDAADNIAGLPSAFIKGKNHKVGPAAAYGLLEACTDDWQCYRVMTHLWATSTHEWTDYRTGEATSWQKNMIADMKLLWMRRKPDENDVLHWLQEKLT